MLTVAESGGSRHLLQQHVAPPFAAALRVGVALLVIPLGLLAAPADSRWTMLLMGGFALGWSLIQGHVLCWVWSGWTATSGFWLGGDVVVLSALALTQPWTTPREAIATGGTGWAMVVIALTMVSWQLYVPIRQAVVACTMTLGTLVLTAVMLPLGITFGYVAELLWVASESVMTRLLYGTLLTAAGKTDLTLARVVETRKRSELAIARRREEQMYAATLHDTAASTLLMVGLGAVDRSASWLQAQARRDLATMSDPYREADPESPRHLPGLLRQAAEEQPDLTISRQRVPDVALDARTSAALLGATREALANVVRHAPGSPVDMTGGTDSGRAWVDIVDYGPGFAPGNVPTARRGIIHSIVARMDACGGLGRVDSQPGQGTRVHLEWPP